MINRPFHQWLLERAATLEFEHTTAQTDTAKDRQANIELALRFFAFRNVAYSSGLDVHEYLDEALFDLASSQTVDLDAEADVFRRTFRLLNGANGDRVFRKWDGAAFSGKFLMSVFEVVATGVSKNIDAIEALGGTEAGEYVIRRCKDLWSDDVFNRNSGAGIRGTTRLANLLPMAGDFFKP